MGAQVLIRESWYKLEWKLRTTVSYARDAGLRAKPAKWVSATCLC